MKLLLVQCLHYQIYCMESISNDRQPKFAKFCDITKIMGDFACLYLQKGKVYKKSLIIRRNAQIHSRPKGQSWSTRIGSVPKNP